MKKVVLILALLMPFVLLATLVSAQVAATKGPAELITVTTTDPAANPGDGFCSLIEALDNANADADTSGGDCPAGSGADTVVLGVATTYTLTAVHNSVNGANGLPAITSTVTISGQGSTIGRDAAASTFRIFYVGIGGDLTLDNLSLVGGVAAGGTPVAARGGGILNDGGTLLLHETTLRDNLATNGGGIYTAALLGSATTTVQDSFVYSNTAAASGGGLAVAAGQDLTGTLNVVASQVSYNSAGVAAGGIRATRFAGSTTWATVVNVLNSEISHNTVIAGPGAVGGGGFVVNYADVLIADSLVTDNRVETGPAYGGGLINAFSDVTILRTTFKDNLAASAGGSGTGGGGAIVSSDGATLIVNSTLGDNAISGAATGAALLATNFFGTAPSTVTLVNSTVSGNSATAGAGAAATLDLAGGQPLVIDFANSIVSGNTGPAGNCAAPAGTTISSSGHNLEDMDTCGFNQPGDLVNTDALLGPLQANGDPTPTFAPLYGSPVIDAADLATCTAPPVDGLDQRGVSRPQGAGCDMGAVEVGPPAGLEAGNDSPTVVGNPTTFTATLAAGEAVTYTWDFGDGSSGAGAVASHTYAAPGIYSATVTATNAVNSLSVTTVATVAPEPAQPLYLPLMLKQP